MRLQTTIGCWRMMVATLCLCCATSVQAGGPLLVGGPTFGVDGQAFVWDNTKTIQYRTDGGALGSLTNSSANDLVAQAFRTWAEVSTASLSFARAGPITGIADGNVSTIAELDTALGSCYSGAQTPIIYDENGSLLLELTGDDSVLGLAGLCLLNPSGKIQSAFAILGNPPTLSADFVPAVMVHEFGHLIGLGHTDVPSPWTTGTTQADVDATPTMSPVLFTPMQSSLGVDDVAWVSRLYPSAGYASSFGMITGQVLFSDGKYPVQGALVVARNVYDIHVTVVAGVAGYRFTMNPGQPYTKDYLPCTPSTACPNGFLGDNSAGSEFGSRDPSLIGYYELPVPPGLYTIEVHSLFSDYSGFFDPTSAPFPLPGPAEPWDTDESANDGDALTDRTPGIVTVAAGSAVSEINIILNGTDPPFDTFEHSLFGSVGNRLTHGNTLYAWRNEGRAPRANQ